jgi:hypothetical protein
MSTEEINLIVLTYDEWISWKSKFQYQTEWPLHAWAKFIRAGQVTDRFDVSEYRQIQVNSEMSVSEIIDEVRKFTAEFERDYRKRFPWRESQSPDFSKMPGHLYCPSLSGQPLPDTARISELGIKDLDLVIVDLYILARTFHPLNARPVKDFEEFQRMVSTKENQFGEIIDYRILRNVWLYAVLLYTDEDIELATYIREHFDELHQMSGAAIDVYVIESRLKSSIFAASSFWRRKIDQTSYLIWSLLGWTRSKPYDKSAAYEIARSLNIYPDQLPCLAILAKTNQVDKIVFPIHGDFRTFFRTTFSNIQRSLDGVDIRAIYDRISPGNRSGATSDNVQQELFNKIRESMKKGEEEKRRDRTVYNFYGQTVFINKAINTGGGHYIAGDVNAGRDFVGGDKTEK